MSRTVISRNGAFLYRFPFEPPWEDLRAKGTASGGVTFCLFDSCVEREPEKRNEIDRRVADILARSEHKGVRRGWKRKKPERRTDDVSRKEGRKGQKNSTAHWAGVRKTV